MITRRPVPPQAIRNINDDVTGLGFTVLHFEHAGDIAGFRGPASPEFFKRGLNTSFNVFSKPYTAVFRREPNGAHLVDEKPAFHNTDYSARKSYGPFYCIALEDDTYYYCLQGIEPFQPLIHEMHTLQQGEKFNTVGYEGYNLIVLQGSLRGVNEFDFCRITSQGAMEAETSDTLICIARKANPNQAEEV